MDFKDNPEQASFRKKCREWLEKNAKLKIGVEKNEFANIDFLQAAKDWQKKKYDAGWAMLHWPKEYGGIAASAIERIIWSEEESKFDVPRGIFEIGLGMCGPVMMEYASEDQKARFLPPMAEGKEIWCQLFSEPSAGSDVAGLRSKAVQDGDNWIINGQKVWTSGAHFSDVLDPAEKRAMLTLETSKFSISSTTNSSSPKSTFEPALLLEATGKIFLDLNFLS